METGKPSYVMIEDLNTTSLRYHVIGWNEMSDEMGFLQKWLKYTEYLMINRLR